jgi:N-acetylglucosamine-1-phosphodiester alpha-N-acetylglucosaminidase
MLTNLNQLVQCLDITNCRYLPESEVHEGNFDHLVGGVVWLVRNGEVYVDVSKSAECPETQLTGH